MPKRVLAILLLAAGAVACARHEETAGQPPARPHYLSDVPRILNSRLLDTTGSPDAEHRGLVVQLPMDSVATYYRQVLPAQGWRLVGDVADTANVSLFLQRDSLSLWVQVHKIGPLSTEYALTATGKTAATGAPEPRPEARKR